MPNMLESLAARFGAGESPTTTTPHGRTMIGHARPQQTSPDGRPYGVFTNRSPRRRELSAMAYDVGSALQGQEATRSGEEREAIAREEAERQLADVMRRAMGGAEAPAAPTSTPASGYQGIGPGIDGEPMGRGMFGATARASRQATDPNAVRLQIIEAARNGVDVRPHLAAFEQQQTEAARDGYLATVPEAERPSARLDPSGHAAWTRDASKPDYFSISGRLVEADPRTRQAREIYAAPEQAKEPTQDAVLGRILSKVAANITLTPGERQIYSRYENGTGGGASDTPNRILGTIQAKIAAGQPLTAGEQQLYDDSKLSRIDPITSLMLGGGVPGVGAQPGGRQAQPSQGKVQVQGGVYQPQSAADMASVPKGARFMNPATGEVLVKSR